jgi:hypothetical protein
MMSIHYQGSPNNAMHLIRHLKVAGNIFLSLRPGDGKRSEAGGQMAVVLGTEQLIGLAENPRPLHRS